MNLLARLGKQGKELTLPRLRQGMLLILATTVAYGLDYLFNLTAGRLLDQSGFGVFVALTGVGQIIVVASRVIQTVMTRYVAQFPALPEAQGKTASFFRAMFRRAWFWGGAAMAMLFLASNPLASFLKIDDVRPVWALAAATLLMVVRPIVGGTLQGKQQFAALGGVQIVQAVMRLGLGALLMIAGLGAFGAMAALPLASLFALAYGAFALGKDVWQSTETHHGVSLSDMVRFSAFAAAGLVGYALLVNMDAILAKRFFEPVAAGNYGAAVTLGKVIQFFPLAVIMILFPKAAQRKVTRRDPAGVLLPALLLVFVFCGGVALIYALFTDTIVRYTVGASYQVSARLLGLEALAMLLLSTANVWLNYFLSTDRPRFVFLILAGIPLQVVLMAIFHDELWHLPAVMVINGAWLTAAGGLIFMRARAADRFVQGYS